MRSFRALNIPAGLSGYLSPKRVRILREEGASSSFLSIAQGHCPSVLSTELSGLGQGQGPGTSPSCPQRPREQEQVFPAAPLHRVWCSGELYSDRKGSTEPFKKLKNSNCCCTALTHRNKMFSDQSLRFDFQNNLKSGCHDSVCFILSL